MNERIVTKSLNKNFEGKYSGCFLDVLTGCQQITVAKFYKESIKQNQKSKYLKRN
jgi:hypothetical protein